MFPDPIMGQIVVENNMLNISNNPRVPECTYIRALFMKYAEGLRVITTFAAAAADATAACVATGGRTPGRPCVFPFTSRNTTYYACTWNVP